MESIQRLKSSLELEQAAVAQHSRHAAVMEKVPCNSANSAPVPAGPASIAPALIHLHRRSTGLLTAPNKPRQRQPSCDSHWTRLRGQRQPCPQLPQRNATCPAPALAPQQVHPSPLAGHRRGGAFLAAACHASPGQHARCPCRPVQARAPPRHHTDASATAVSPQAARRCVVLHPLDPPRRPLRPGTPPPPSGEAAAAARPSAACSKRATRLTPPAHCWPAQWPACAGSCRRRSGRRRRRACRPHEPARHSRRLSRDSATPAPCLLGPKPRTGHAALGTGMFPPSLPDPHH